MNNILKMAKTFRLMNAAHLTSRFEQIEEDNAWDELFFKINLRSDDQEKQLRLSFDVSTSFENVEKNRYRNVLPYDQNRVILKRAGRANSSDYINASPLKIPAANRNYILSQGPLSNTADDFWQMVHEQNAEIVIMLSKIMEKNFIKCHSYFPHQDNSIERFDSWEVELLSEEVKPHYVLRRIRLKPVDPVQKDEKNETKTTEKGNESLSSVDSKSPEAGKEKSEEASASKDENTGKKKTSRIIHHFQYMTWPDFGVPEHTDHFLEFLTHIRDLQKRLKANRAETALTGSNNTEELKSKDRLETVEAGNKSESTSYGGEGNGGIGGNSSKVTKEDGGDDPPLVCHCSAGIGRTGAFVVIDTAISVLEKNSRQLKDTCPHLAKAEESEVSSANNAEKTKEPKPAENNNNGGEPSTNVVEPMKEGIAKEGEKQPSGIKSSEEVCSKTTEAVKETEKEEEEDLAVAQKKKMRSEGSEKPLTTNFKLICTAPAQQPTATNNNKQKGEKEIFDSGSNSNGDKPKEISSGDDFEDLETLCDLVVFIRKYRMGLIQTPQQLRFCWKAIVDWIGSNNK